MKYQICITFTYAIPQDFGSVGLEKYTLLNKINAISTRLKKEELKVVEKKKKDRLQTMNKGTTGVTEFTLHLQSD